MREADGSGQTGLSHQVAPDNHLTQLSMLFAHCGSFNGYDWELSQFALALLANFGASLHNAVSEEHDSS